MGLTGRWWCWWWWWGRGVLGVVVVGKGDSLAVSINPQSHD